MIGSLYPGACLVLVHVLALHRRVSFNVFQTEHLPLQTQFKEKGAGGLQPSVSKARAVLTQVSFTVLSDGHNRSSYPLLSV